MFYLCFECVFFVTSDSAAILKGMSALPHYLIIYRCPSAASSTNADVESFPFPFEEDWDRPRRAREVQRFFGKVLSRWVPHQALSV